MRALMLSRLLAKAVIELPIASSITFADLTLHCGLLAEPWPKDLIDQGGVRGQVTS